MEAFAKWLLEEFLTPLILGFCGACVAAFWRIMNKISTGDKRLHERIDKIRDDYVKQDHLDRQMDHMNRRIDELKEDGHQRHKDMKEYIADQLGRDK